MSVTLKGNIGVLHISSIYRYNVFMFIIEKLILRLNHGIDTYPQHTKG